MAAQRATYSTVNSATRLVSRPNQMPPGSEWNTGTVSRIVTSAENAMSPVTSTCTSTADADELGRSSRLYRYRRHAGSIAVVVVVVGVVIDDTRR